MRRALRKALLPGSPAKRAFALLDPLGRTATPFAAMEDGIFGDLETGTPTHGVTKAINELRELGLDIRAERRYRLPPASHRRRLTTPFQRRIVDAIQAGHDEFYELADHLELSNLQLSRALSRMRSRNGFYVERTYGYRLAWASSDPIHPREQEIAA